MNSDSKLKSRLLALILFLVVIGCFDLLGEKRTIINLSNNEWTISLDKKAEWEYDRLFAPPVDITKLPINIPTGGWGALDKFPQKKAHLPATVEQYFWGENGNTYGSAGNYLGVSWFSTKVTIPKELKGKRLILNVENARLRAEVFVNKKLVGYDLVNGMPFDVNISNAVNFGKENSIDIRITDPNGNFNWKDSQVFKWGDYYTIPTHGFGGLAGKVSITATDHCFIQDVFIKNKPSINDVELVVSLTNKMKISDNGKVEVQISDNDNQEIVFEKSYPVSLMGGGTTVTSYKIHVDDAEYWDVDHPNLYDLKLTYTSDDCEDTFEKRFGFRWFEIRDVDGDRQLFLNNKRIVLRTAISWGFWPGCGLAPTDSFARKQIEIAKALGQNMINFHRQAGHTNVLDYADELGLLCFEEPGGNQYPAYRFNAKDSLGKVQADFYFTVRNEKLKRMILRDRSHPSLIIYNLHNERGAYPQAQDSAQMIMAHQLDETRLLTYNSSNGENPIDEPNPRFKLHMLPYDHTFKDYGWWDRHHAGGPGVYHDNLYKDPSNYHRMANHSDEIIFWGEEGAIGTPPRLQLIKDYISEDNLHRDWQSDDYLKWYDAYDHYLDDFNFRSAFPDVESLTHAMGNVSFYYQGRMIENIRMNNIVDGYAINGWEGIKLENHSGVVDNYRNPKGDIDLISRYNQPVYVAVKIREKVLPCPDHAIVDFFLVNEVNLNGTYKLVVEAFDQKDHSIFKKDYDVTISGGNVYGELLVDSIIVPILQPGYISIKAKLMRNEQVEATGSDELFAVKELLPENLTSGMVADTSGTIQNFLKSKGINNYHSYMNNGPEDDWLMIGETNLYDMDRGAGISRIMEWVYNGHTLIVINDADKWADFLCNKELLDYRGSQILGKSWFGGNYFVKENPYFENLPVNCVFNWEYQALATYNKKRLGLRVFNGETLVGCVSDHKKEAYSAFSVIPAGRGKIILTSLDLFSCIKDINNGNQEIDIDGLNASINSYNTSLANKSNVVGQQLLLNILRNYNRD